MESTQCQPIPARKVYPSKFRVPRKDTEAPKPTVNEPLNSRKKRVFGTARSTNIVIKQINAKPDSKSSFPVLQNPPKSTHAIKIPSGNTGKPTVKVAEKKSRENPDPNLKKKRVILKRQVLQKAESSSPEDNIAEPRTPVTLAQTSRLKNSCTPYYSAEKCSNCRFDKLETSSYWLSQIKLAESVGKHFVSAAFFRLSHESNAEPSRNLRLELKRYLNRHEHLSADTEWRDLCLSFGLSKNDGKAGGPENSSTENEHSHIEDQSRTEIKNQENVESDKQVQSSKSWPERPKFRYMDYLPSRKAWRCVIEKYESKFSSLFLPEWNKLLKQCSALPGKFV